MRKTRIENMLGARTRPRHHGGRIQSNLHKIQHKIQHKIRHKIRHKHSTRKFLARARTRSLSLNGGCPTFNQQIKIKTALILSKQTGKRFEMNQFHIDSEMHGGVHVEGREERIFGDSETIPVALIGPRIFERQKPSLNLHFLQYIRWVYKRGCVHVTMAVVPKVMK